MWEQDAACLGQPLELFYQRYESDLDVAWAVDKQCLGCPVQRHCFNLGASMKADGVWGGVYLDNGSICSRKNAHKTQEQWDIIKEKLGVDPFAS